jgi:uncharacterized protein
LSLEQDLAVQAQDAARAGDTVRRDTLRQLRAALHNEAISRGGELADDVALTVVKRLVNQHKDSITEFTKAGRTELAAKEEAELAILSEYLPEELSRDEIVAAVKSAIASTGASGRKDMGKVMREVSGALRGRADMRAVSEIVQELLGE